jgi:KGK domain
MENKLTSLNNDDVVSVNLSEINNKTFFLHPTFKINHLMAKINESLNHKISDEEKKQLLGDGIDCELLTTNLQGWKKGKLRLKLEFHPDEPEQETILKSNLIEASTEISPLDDLRQQFQQTSA